LKRFHGWEPETVYMYDGDRLVSSRPEPEWDDREQTVMLALAAYRASLCVCGEPSEVCSAPENEGRYQVEGPIRCHKETALRSAGKKLDEKIHYPEALMFGAWLKPLPGS
jgi:hypothetical protein